MSKYHLDNCCGKGCPRNQGLEIWSSQVGWGAYVCVCVCVMNTTNTLSSKLYLEGNHTCVATSKYGTDEKHFVIKGGEKIRYFETSTMHTELRLAI